MIQLPFRAISKKFLGVDIGTSNIKIVEVGRFGKRLILENYGELSAEIFYKKPFRTFEKSTLLLTTPDIAKAIKSILEETKIKTKKAYFSIPDFCSFFTWFELPQMTEKELPEAVKYAARQRIPIPLSEVTLDWQIIEGKIGGSEKTRLKILLVTVPNEIINQYRAIAIKCQLELQALEAEVFGFCRSLVKNENKVTALVDIGAQSTTVSVIDNKVLKRSHSFDVSGGELTYTIAKSLGIDYNEAEDLKREYGLNLSPQNPVRDIISPFMDLIIAEIEKISRDFFQTESKSIEKIILAGGSALLPGLEEYFQKGLQKETLIANPFSEFFYPSILGETLRKMGPSYAIAVGMALKGLE
jgi:type IV pilus assembly protein PilM